MRKFVMQICILLAVTLSAVIVKGMDEKDMEDMLRNLSQDCKEQEKASDKDVDIMVDKKYPETKEGKCMIACMQEQFGVVKDGKFSKEGFLAVASMAAGDDEKKLEAADRIADDCKTVTDPDRCEQAIKIGKCMQQGAEKEKLVPE